METWVFFEEGLDIFQEIGGMGVRGVSCMAYNDYPKLKQQCKSKAAGRKPSYTSHRASSSSGSTAARLSNGQAAGRGVTLFGLLLASRPGSSYKIEARHRGPAAEPLLTDWAVAAAGPARLKSLTGRV